MPKKPLVAVLTLLCVLFTYMVPWNLVYAAGAQSPPRPPAFALHTAAAASTPVSSRLEAALRKVERLLDRMQTAGAAAYSDVDRQMVRDAAATVTGEGSRLLAKLEQVATRLEQENRPDRFRQRNQHAKDRVSQDLTPLTAALDALADVGRR